MVNIIVVGMSYNLDDLLNVSPDKIENIDELCSHTYTTLSRHMDKNLARDDDWEFKIIDADRNNNTISIEWFIVAGKKEPSRNENISITVDIINIMDKVHIKR